MLLFLLLLVSMMSMASRYIVLVRYTNFCKHQIITSVIEFFILACPIKLFYTTMFSRHIYWKSFFHLLVKLQILQECSSSSISWLFLSFAETTLDASSASMFLLAAPWLFVFSTVLQNWNRQIFYICIQFALCIFDIHIRQGC